jgi:hypothetical protein
MKLKHIVSLVLAAGVFSAQAQNVSSFSNLRLNFGTSNSAYSGCNELVFDAIGDFANGTSFLMPGSLNCRFGSTFGSLAVIGSGYFAGPNIISIRLRLPIGDQINCDGLNASTLSGSCRLQSSNLTDIGFVNVSLK